MALIGDGVVESCTDEPIAFTLFWKLEKKFVRIMQKY